MFCVKCGNKLMGDAVFCNKCGAKVERENSTREESNTASPTIEPTAGSSKLLKSIPRNDGETVQFFDDQIQIGSTILRYSDITSIQISAALGGWNVAIFIPVLKTFKANVSFLMNDGLQIQIKTSWFIILGIGNKRKKATDFTQVFNGVIEIAVPYVAKEYIEKIRQGETIQIEDVKIDENSAVYHIDPRKAPIIVTRDNYGGCSFKQHFFAENETLDVMDNKNRILFKLESDRKNVFVLECILDELFGK